MKSPRPDGVRGCWIKNLSKLQNSVALQLDRCLQENNLPKWMVTEKTLLCIKKFKKETWCQILDQSISYL